MSLPSGAVACNEKPIPVVISNCVTLTDLGGLGLVGIGSAGLSGSIVILVASYKELICSNPVTSTSFSLDLLTDNSLNFLGVTDSP